MFNSQDEGLIETSIGRDPKSRVKMAVLPENRGRNAITKWKVAERMSYACLLEIELLTGRTHQIRVHFNYINSPLIGDRTYGDFSALPLRLKKAADRFGRQALHSSELIFNHPVTNKKIHIYAPLPDDMTEVIDEFRKYKP